MARERSTSAVSVGDSRQERQALLEVQCQALADQALRTRTFQDLELAVTASESILFKSWDLKRCRRILELKCTDLAYRALRTRTLPDLEVAVKACKANRVTNRAAERCRVLLDELQGEWWDQGTPGLRRGHIIAVLAILPPELITIVDAYDAKLAIFAMALACEGAVLRYVHAPELSPAIGQTLLQHLNECAAAAEPHRLFQGDETFMRWNGRAPKAIPNAQPPYPSSVPDPLPATSSQPPSATVLPAPSSQPPSANVITAPNSLPPSAPSLSGPSLLPPAALFLAEPSSHPPSATVLAPKTLPPSATVLAAPSLQPPSATVIAALGPPHSATVFASPNSLPPPANVLIVPGSPPPSTSVLAAPGLLPYVPALSTPGLLPPSAPVLAVASPTSAEAMAVPYAVTAIGRSNYDRYSRETEYRLFMMVHMAAPQREDAPPPPDFHVSHCESGLVNDGYDPSVPLQTLYRHASAKGLNRDLLRRLMGVYRFLPSALHPTIQTPPSP